MNFAGVCFCNIYLNKVIHIRYLQQTVHLFFFCYFKFYGGSLFCKNLLVLFLNWR